MRASSLAAVALVAGFGASGCGNLLGIDDVTLGDGGGGGGDGGYVPPDGAVPIRFHGNLLGTSDGLQSGPLAGAAVQFHLETGVFVKSVDADASGDYDITVDVAVPVDGYLEIHETGFPVFFDHLVIPASTDTEMSATDYTEAAIDSDAELGSVAHPAGSTYILVEVVDSTGAPVENAGVSVKHSDGTFGTVCYSDPGGGPNCSTEHVTEPDGYAYDYDVPTDANLVITATAGGNVGMYSFPVMPSSIVYTPVRMP